MVLTLISSLKYIWCLLPEDISSYPCGAEWLPSFSFQPPEFSLFSSILMCRPSDTFPSLSFSCGNLSTVANKSCLMRMESWSFLCNAIVSANVMCEKYWRVSKYFQNEWMNERIVLLSSRLLLLGFSHSWLDLWLWQIMPGLDFLREGDAFWLLEQPRCSGHLELAWVRDNLC